jgi:hypothetical protein
MDLVLFLVQSSDSGDLDNVNWPLAFFLVGTTVAIAAAVCVLVWQAMLTWRSRMSVAREEAYRSLTEDLARFQSRIADSLERSNSELVEIRQRATEVERLLKEVG